MNDFLIKKSLCLIKIFTLLKKIVRIFIKRFRMFYIYAILAIAVTLIILKFVLRFTFRIFATVFIIIAVFTTLVLMVVQPKMHKEFNFNVIERVLKFNDDGSTSIIETTTTNEVRRK